MLIRESHMVGERREEEKRNWEMGGWSEKGLALGLHF